MDFGKLARIEDVDFSFPPLPPDSEAWLDTLPEPQEPPRVFVGCPVWGNKSWRGKVYPEKARERDFLSFYARQFACIELNTTHYRIPDLNTIRRWRSQTPADFLFCPKIPQEISHKHQLKHAKALSDQFVYAISGLESRLGLSFLQLPPTFSPAQGEVLCRYLEDFPDGVALSVEFRHPAWFDGSRSEEVDTVFDFMRQHGFGTVITDVAGRRDVLHQRLSSTTLAVRFIGNGLHPTDFTRADDWVTHLKDWTKRGIRTVYFWVHQPDNDLAPEMARYVIQQFNKELGLELNEPVLVPAHKPSQQTSLF